MGWWTACTGAARGYHQANSWVRHCSVRPYATGGYLDYQNSLSLRKKFQVFDGRHMVIWEEDPQNPNQYLILGILTSSSNHNSKLLSAKLNLTGEPKDQRFIDISKLKISVDKSQISTNPKALEPFWDIPELKKGAGESLGPIIFSQIIFLGLSLKFCLTLLRCFSLSVFMCG